MLEEPERPHKYFAEASALRGSLRLPFVQDFCAPTFVKLNEKGGYISQHTENFRLGGVVSFRAAYTQVAGNRDIKKDHGWNTLATSVIENLNVMDVLTADRIVSQISTDHPLVGYIPTVTFLGSRIENLRIAGESVKFKCDAKIFRAKGQKDAPYTIDAESLKEAGEQYNRVSQQKDLPAEIAKRYNQHPSDSAKQGVIHCSLVNEVEKGTFAATPYGHLLNVPNFGWISLGNVTLEESDPSDTGVPRKTTITLTMLEIHMGCIGGGSLGGGIGKTNGQSGG